MKLGLMGDIHGNHLALAAVIEAVRREGVDRLLITGDLIGYYFHPAEVLVQLESWQVDAVCGNHEVMLSRARREPGYLEETEAKYGSGLRIAIATLTAKQLDWLESLPHPLELEADGRTILLCHGSPWDFNEYVYPDAAQSVVDRCARSGHDFVVLGHTHYPMNRQSRGTTIVNPGSVGQPRRRRSGAEWALLDTESGVPMFFDESYDATEVVRESERRHPELPYISRVLEGRR